MKVSKRTLNAQRSRDHLSQRLQPLIDTPVPAPHAGWIRATRDALDMNAAQLARRLGVSRSLISRFESGEQTGSIKLGTLQRAAEAMDCTLVYAFVPNGGSHDGVLNRQSQRSTSGAVRRTLHTMALEDQSPDAIGTAQLQRQVAANQIESRKLWDS